MEGRGDGGGTSSGDRLEQFSPRPDSQIPKRLEPLLGFRVELLGRPAVEGAEAGVVPLPGEDRLAKARYRLRTLGRQVLLLPWIAFDIEQLTNYDGVSLSPPCGLATPNKDGAPSPATYPSNRFGTKLDLGVVFDPGANSNQSVLIAIKFTNGGTGAGGPLKPVATGLQSNLDDNGSLSVDFGTSFVTDVLITYNEAAFDNVGPNFNTNPGYRGIAILGLAMLPVELINFSVE